MRNIAKGTIGLAALLTATFVSADENTNILAAEGSTHNEAETRNARSPAAALRTAIASLEASNPEIFDVDDGSALRLALLGLAETDLVCEFRSKQSPLYEAVDPIFGPGSLLGRDVKMALFDVCLHKAAEDHALATATELAKKLVVPDQEWEAIRDIRLDSGSEPSRAPAP